MPGDDPITPIEGTSISFLIAVNRFIKEFAFIRDDRVITQVKDRVYPSSDFEVYLKYADIVAPVPSMRLQPVDGITDLAVEPVSA